MPTHEELTQFLRDWGRLTPSQQALFLAAVRAMVAEMRAARPFHGSLRIKRVQGHPGIFEMTRAGDGRATFQFGAERSPREPHIIWRRIGRHEVLTDP